MLGYQATAMGKMPILDEEGKPTGNYDKIEGPERHKFWAKLIDKGMPSTPAKEEELPKERLTMKEAELYEDEDSMATLDDAALREIAALPYVPTTSNKNSKVQTPWG